MTDFTTVLPHEATLGAASSADSQAMGRTRTLPLRPIKIGVGLSLLMAGIYGVVSDRQVLSSDNAVVSAYQAEVRSPIDGVLSGMPATTGEHLSLGEFLGVVDNPLSDRDHLQSLALLQQQASSGAEAAEAERASLSSQEQELLERANGHLTAVSSRLESERVQAERLLAARVASLAEARLELERGVQLHQAGILADAEFDKLQSMAVVAAAEESAQRAAVATVEIKIRAAERGILSETGLANDVSYSRQRADEVQMRLAEVERNRNALTAQAAQAKSDLDAEGEHAALLTHRRLVSPVAGVLWQLDAVNGERVSSGEEVARVVSCEQSFVLASIPQDRVPRLSLGALARIRLSGESRELYGKVLAISGETQLEGERKLAASPTRDPRQQSALVRISIEGLSSTECAVGRSARVLITLNGEGFLSRIWPHHW